MVGVATVLDIYVLLDYYLVQEPVVVSQEANLVTRKFCLAFETVYAYGLLWGVL